MEINPEGRALYSVAQERWSEVTDTVQTARFAGQSMLVSYGTHGDFLLSYLGFDLGGFKSMDEAKAAAPAFARKVLIRLVDMISQADPSTTSAL